MEGLVWTGGVGHYTCQRYNGKKYNRLYTILSATFIPYIISNVFDKSLSDAHSPICLDFMFENSTRKHTKKISDSENDNKQDKHFIEYKLLDVRKTMNNLSTR